MRKYLVFLSVLLLPVMIRSMESNEKQVPINDLLDEQTNVHNECVFGQKVLAEAQQMIKKAHELLQKAQETNDLELFSNAQSFLREALEIEKNAKQELDRYEITLKTIEMKIAEAIGFDSLFIDEQVIQKDLPQNANATDLVGIIVKPRAYIQTFWSEIGGRIWNLEGPNNCYYKKPTFHFSVHFDKPVTREFSNNFAKLMMKHGEYVLHEETTKYGKENNLQIKFATTMNEKEFKTFLDRVNKLI